MVGSRSTSSSSPPPTADTAAPLELDQNEPRINSLVSLLSFSPLVFSGTDFPFSTHSLTHSLRVHSTTTPSSCTSAGVSCFALLLPHGAAHADPRREGGGEEPNAHLLPKIVYDHRRLLLVVDSDGMWKRPPPSQKNAFHERSFAVKIQLKCFFLM